MALLQLRLDTDPLLRKKSKEVKEITPGIKTLVEDMIETMKHSDGAGLAAVQVGKLRNILVYDLHDGSEPKVMINPVIFSQEGNRIGGEGCLSLPDQYGYVERHQKISGQAMDLEGKVYTFEAQDFEARVIQHEFDHLQGVLICDKFIDEELLDFPEEDEEGEVLGEITWK